MENSHNLSIALEAVKKTIGYNLEPVKFEDIPNKISEILSSCLHKTVTIEGNGLTSSITATIEE